MVDVVTGRVCKATKDDGSPCEAAPLTDGEYCFFHSPEHAEEVAEAGRLGGLRRRREKTVAAAYDLDGLGSLEQIRRLLEVGDFQERLAALEAAVGPRLLAKGGKRR
jgi:hypothetical protein